MNYFKLIAGILVTLFIGIFGIMRIAVEAIGWTTTPDDLDALIKKMPAMFRWLFATPWPVPTLIIVALAAFAAWLLWSGTKKTVSDEMADQAGLTEEDVKRLIAEANEINSLDAGTFDPPVTAEYVQTTIDGILSQLQIPEFKTAVALALKNTQDAAEEAKKHATDIAKISNAGNAAGLETLSDHVGRLQDFVTERFRSINDRLDWIAQGFAAVGHWDWHSRLYPALVERGDLLTSISSVDQITLEHWHAWDAGERHWRNDIEQWLIIANYYAINAREAVFEISDSVYYSDKWQLNEASFPNADAIKRYKEFSIILMNLKNVRSYVDSAIRTAAFESVGKKGRPNLNEDQ